MSSGSSAASCSAAPITSAHLGPLLDDVEAADARRAGGRRQQRRQHQHGRRLAGAVRAEEAVDLAVLDGELDPVDGPRPLLELPDEPVDLDCVLGPTRPVYELGLGSRRGGLPASLPACPGRRRVNTSAAGREQGHGEQRLLQRLELRVAVVLRDRGRLGRRDVRVEERLLDVVDRDDRDPGRDVPRRAAAGRPA